MGLRSFLSRIFPFKDLARKNLAAFCSAAACNDTGEEMYAPYLAFFAKNFLGADPAQYGLIEAFAEATNRILRIFTGAITDKIGRKKPVILGYVLIVLSRLGLFFANFWYDLIPFRMLRQVGRALRDPAREASITDTVPKEMRGKAFGLLESVDTIGSVLGPFIGIMLLSYFTFNTFSIAKDSYSEQAFRYLFLMAGIPTTISAIIILFWLAETRKATNTSIRATIVGNFKEFIKNEKLMVVSSSNMLLAIGAVPVQMLLFYTYDFPDATPAIGAFIFIIYSLFHFFSAYPAGIMTDRIGRKNSMIITNILLIIALIIAATVGQAYLLAIPLLLYGVFESFWVSSRRATIADLAPEKSRGQTLGTFSTFYGAASLLSPLLFGFIWKATSVKIAFGVAIFFCIISVLVLYFKFKDS